MEIREIILIPVLAAGCIITQIVTLCTRNWMEGYYGDVAVVTLCPWRLCHLNCLNCVQGKPTFGCFWIQEWGETGFETFGIVSHLEYWTMGFIIFGLLLSMLDCAFIKRRMRHSIDFTKANLLVFIIASLLSTLSVSLFGAKLHHQTSYISTFNDVKLHFAWPFSTRMLSALLVWATTVAAICGQCTSTTRHIVAEDNNILVVSSERDYDEDSIDEGESGVLL